jgi:hypothetical protein
MENNHATIAAVLITSALSTTAAEFEAANGMLVKSTEDGNMTIQAVVDRSDSNISEAYLHG